MGCRYSLQMCHLNGKSNFQNELTNPKFVSNWKLNLAYRQHPNMKPITLFHSNSLYRTLNNFGPLNDHIIINFHVLSPCHRPCTALTSCGDLWRHSGHCQDDCNCGVFAISDHTKLFLGLCNINEWWGHRVHNLFRFGRNFLCHVTYLPISLQERPRFVHSVRVDLQQPVEFKILRTGN